MNHPELSPPVAPEGEELATASASFLKACHSYSADIIAKGGWKLGKQLVTRSKIWGTIWRADFTIPGEDASPLMNRIVCCEKPDGKFIVQLAIGQDVPPLGVAEVDSHT